MCFAVASKSQRMHMRLVAATLYQSILHSIINITSQDFFINVHFKTVLGKEYILQLMRMAGDSSDIRDQGDGSTDPVSLCHLLFV